MWLDDIKGWAQLSTYEDIKRLAQGRCQWRACTEACQPSDQLMMTMLVYSGMVGRNVGDRSRLPTMRRRAGNEQNDVG